MLEKESPSSSNSLPCSHVVGLEMGAKLAYSRCYRSVTEGFIDVFMPLEIEGAITTPDETTVSDMSPRRRAALGLVIAIGAQVKSSETARDVGQHYFRRAQHCAFGGMLEDPDIDMVRSFLLMAFYLLGECRRNAAFMYLGIATRAAVALGLHSRESYADLSNSGDNLRLRVWISLRIVDMLVNSVLGRPAATAGLHSDINSIIADMPSPLQDDDMKRLVASHQIVSIINSIVDRLYERKELSTSVVEQLLNDIESWVGTLPECLRSASVGDEAIGADAHRDSKGTMGGIHVSCLYYFAVTLATRPILISTLAAAPASGDEVQCRLASACLDAAAFLVQTCVDARRANLLYGNMCIIKALVFSAGLVLGFEIFAKRSVDYDRELAFRGARDVLDFLARQSPQAAHYYEILTLLANSIAKQREKTASKSQGRYVSKIFTLNRAEQAVGSEAGRERGGLPISLGSLDCAQGPADEGASWFEGEGTLADSGEGGMLLGWDSLDISQWDSFPFLP